MAPSIPKMNETLEVTVLIKCSAWTEAVPGAEDVCRRSATAAFRAGRETAELPPGPYEASVVLADDGFIRPLNRQYRGRDEPTNVLSFANLEGSNGKEGDTAGPRPGQTPRVLGDVIVAYETMRAEADKDGGDIGDHLCHLVVHGMLHLLGYDHGTDAEAERMERMEVRVLSALGAAGHIADGMGR